MLNRLLSKLYVSIFGLVCLSVQASDEPYGLCRDVLDSPVDQQATPTDIDPAVRFSADHIKRDESGVITLEGSPRITQGIKTVDADVLRYNENNEKIYARGNVRAEDEQLIINSQEAELHLDTNYVRTSNATYQYKPRHARGQADNIEQPSPEFTRLENATYTTCDERSRFWALSASKVELDKTSGEGTGKHVVVKLKDVPIFYTPWIRFPIDDRRKSGFLIPTIGDSSDSGFEFETPWYWNIAPHRDAVLTPRLMTSRGLQMKSQFRYLNEKSFGQLGAEYLDDRKFDDDRYLVSFKHQGNLTSRIKLDFLYNKASDQNYFEDLDNRLGLTSTQHIERHGELRYFGKHWQFLTRAQSFQVVDDSTTNKPLERLPQVRLDGSYFDLPGGFDFSAENEWVSFEHDGKTDGNRLHLGIELQRPFESTGYFVRPGIRLTHTEYDLNRDGNDNSDDKPSRSVPSAYLDAGLRFERNLKKFRHIQTLEPRMYYLHTPFRNQSDIPVFDTNEHEFSFKQLFRNDRFSGKDRIGDADQLSIGVTTRVLSADDGTEKLRASIGRIFYFRDRKVTLHNEPIERENSSEIDAELKIGLNDRLQAIASTVLNTHDNHTEKSSFRLQYKAENGFVFNMAYRYRHEELEQSDISMVLPINDHWRTVMRWNYDIEESRNLELLAGIEYNSCCWKIRLMGRRYNQNTDEDYNNSIELQLILKGLTRIGSPIGELLERNIRGYDGRDNEHLL